nr:hypothetical protein [Paenibacillus ginsengihumi]
MLHFVQQFLGAWLKNRKHRPKCCTKYNIEPQIGVFAPFLLYKTQHLLTILKIWRYTPTKFQYRR